MPPAYHAETEQEVPPEQIVAAGGQAGCKSIVYTYARYVGARLEPVLCSLKTIKRLGIWLEVTTLLILGRTLPVTVVALYLSNARAFEFWKTASELMAVARAAEPG